MSGFNSAVPNGAVCGGQDNKGNSYYVILALLNGLWMPGSLSVGFGAWVSWAGSQHNVTQYQVCPSSYNS